ncbi:siderophore ABC transporter substrate-binding protein [Paracoccus zhejiangensis]|uniref:Iron ABC transporter substrate-binding protein n=1 Tax=Paracoccus zhejiangensis TaxID=1077935 RepID=A0A2H5F412_9RHOB|nr:siderophore ABC transporter substrate-binding protein [Paracoccus zhejiangensis]AUH66298.1 iron ABC transporter substrate-binding protein [Paracoccus zhejiangensis]
MKAFFCALALVLPTALQAETVPVATAAGEVQAPLTPAKTVALDMAAIDTLDALDVAIIGRPDIAPPAYLSETLASVPTVGTLFEPDFEALAALAPDLIVAGGRSQAQVQPLSQIAPTLDMTIGGADLLNETTARIDAYAAIYDRTDAGTALKAELDADLAAARDAITGKGKAMIILTNGGKISAYGANSRFGWLHSALDLPEAYPGLVVENHGEAVSFEFVAEANPDWLLVIDRGAAVGQGGEAAAATLDNPLIAGTTAGKTGQIVYLDGSAMYLAGGGFHSVTGTLEQLTAAFGGAGS